MTVHAHPRVAYWSNIPSPWLVERLNAVAARGAVAVEGWFSFRTWHDRSWDVDESSWRFPYRYLPSGTLAGRRYSLPAPLVARRPPELVVSQYGWSWFVLGWALARARRVRIAFECETTLDAWVTRRRWKETVKRTMFPRLDGVLTAGEEGRRYALRLGAHPERLVDVPHVVDVDHFASVSQAARAGRDELRRRLGVEGTVFLCVGRLWRGKGLDLLLEAFRRLQESQTAPAALVLVGDGPEEPRLRRIAAGAGLDSVVFAGFVQKPDLPRYYAAADVFVFPTLGDPWGLVVEEAMACRLPVIASSAAGEIRSRIADGATGFVCDPLDTAALAERMRELAEDPERRAAIAAAAFETVRSRTPETWAQDFERGVEHILALPRA